MIKNAREAAVLTLCRIDYDGAYSNIALASVLKESGLDRRDRAFAAQLVYGVQMRCITLDYIISKYSSVKLKKLSKYVTEILRTAIYQIIYCDRVPESAAVNEAVKLAAHMAPKSRAFVNGVLRSFIRNGYKYGIPEDEYGAMSVEYSFPKEICEKWSKEFGDARTRSIMSALNEEPEQSVRVNMLRTDNQTLITALMNEGAEVEKSGICEGFFNVRGLDISSSAAFAAGMYSVQDAAAGLAVKILDPKPGEHIADVCAAPGGKCTYAAELMDNRGRIDAFDIHPHKIPLIEQNAERLGIDIINARVGDARAELDTDKASIDKLIVDVPCSGFGIIRRKPDIKKSMTDRDDMSGIQLEILERCVACLKPGGELVYSTCTFESAENEAVTDEFLKRHSEFSAVNISGYLKGFKHAEHTADGHITLFPDTDGTDGFYICKLRRDK